MNAQLILFTACVAVAFAQSSVRLFNGVHVGLTHVDGALNATKNISDPNGVFVMNPDYPEMPSWLSSSSQAQKDAWMENAKKNHVSFVNTDSGKHLCMGKKGKPFLAVNAAKKACVFSKSEMQGFSLLQSMQPMIKENGHNRKLYLGVKYLGYLMKGSQVLPPSPEGLWSIIDSAQSTLPQLSQDATELIEDERDPDYYKKECKHKKCFAEFCPQSQ
ncbi:hypothetical protein [Largemouth bass virus]|uniref:Uncharacterized protein n=1 Tax=Largemouth bass virus TaxID=176656 RepID=A0A9E7PU41_9VIRU|nr:hypothetical protein [Largemouth bass virus]